MIVLDTNVLSELMRQPPDTGVLTWLDAQTGGELFLTAITVAEILYGIARLPDGQRKVNLQDAAMAMFTVDFGGRILPFSEQAAVVYAEVVAGRERLGRPISMADAQIAAICRLNAAALVSRNVKDFDGLGLELINPWVGA